MRKYMTRIESADEEEENTGPSLCLRSKLTPHSNAYLFANENFALSPQAGVLTLGIKKTAGPGVRAGMINKTLGRPQQPQPSLNTTNTTTS